MNVILLLLVFLGLVQVGANYQTFYQKEVYQLNQTQEELKQEIKELKQKIAKET